MSPSVDACFPGGLHTEQSMYMMLSRLGKGVPHLDACMLALGTKQNKDMMVHMHPIECAWMLAVGTKQNTDLVVLTQPRATSLVRLHCTMHLQPLLPSDEQSPTQSRVHWLQAAQQPALERQDAPCPYLAHHELESRNICITIIILLL
jgi:hypothetical protein